MRNHRYHLRYAWSGYQIVDTEHGEQVVFQADSKSECIGKCQELNGYPVDGDERSYASQIKSIPHRTITKT